MKTKFFFTFIFLLSIALSGCKKKTKKVSHYNNSDTTNKIKSNEIQKSVFNEDIDEFELIEETDSNVFTNNGNNKSKTVDDEDFDLSKSDLDDDFETIYFEFDKSDIKNDQQANIEHNTKIAKDATNTGKSVIVEGHADQIGKNRVYNLALSQKRANQVKQNLVKNGIKSENVKTVGRGQEMPASKEAPLTIEEQQVNRRACLATVN